MCDFCCHFCTFSTGLFITWFLCLWLNKHSIKSIMWWFFFLLCVCGNNIGCLNSTSAEIGTKSEVIVSIRWRFFFVYFPFGIITSSHTIELNWRRKKALICLCSIMPLNHYHIDRIEIPTNFFRIQENRFLYWPFAHRLVLIKYLHCIKIPLHRLPFECLFFFLFFSAWCNRIDCIFFPHFDHGSRGNFVV